MSLTAITKNSSHFTAHFLRPRLCYRRSPHQIRSLWTIRPHPLTLYLSTTRRVMTPRTAFRPAAPHLETQRQLIRRYAAPRRPSTARPLLLSHWALRRVAPRPPQRHRSSPKPLPAAMKRLIIDLSSAHPTLAEPQIRRGLNELFPSLSYVHVQTHLNVLPKIQACDRRNKTIGLLDELPHNRVICMRALVDIA